MKRENMKGFLELDTLRRELQEITDSKENDSLYKQIALIAQLKSKGPHEIELIEEFVYPDPDRQYNCFMYALNVWKSREIRNVLRKQCPIDDTPIEDRINVNPKFVKHLINKSVLKEINNSQECRNNDVVVYFLNKEPAHAGKLYDGYVISKWGAGHLWKHKLFEVPESYGDSVRYFYDPDASTIVSGFMKFFNLEGTI